MWGRNIWFPQIVSVQVWEYKWMNFSLRSICSEAVQHRYKDIDAAFTISPFKCFHKHSSTWKKQRRIISTIVKKHHSFINHAATLGFLAKQKKKWNTLQLGFNTLDLTGKTRWPVLRKQMLQLPCYRQIVYSKSTQTAQVWWSRSYLDAELRCEIMWIQTGQTRLNHLDFIRVSRFIRASRSSLSPLSIC